MDIKAFLDYLSINTEAIINGTARTSTKPIVCKCKRCGRFIKVPYVVKKHNWMFNQPITCARCNTILTEMLIEHIGKTIFHSGKGAPNLDEVLQHKKN